MLPSPHAAQGLRTEVRGSRSRPPVAWRLVVLGIAGAAAAGCGAKAKTADAPAVPPLAVPAPPARALPPIDEGLQVLASNPSDGPITESTATIAKPAPPDKRQRAAQDVDPKPDPTPPAGVPAPQSPPLEPSIKAAAEDPGGKQLADALRKTEDALKKIVPSNLSRGNLEQYNDARQFMEIAERAFRERRFSYGLVNVNKAMTIAERLAP